MPHVWEISAGLDRTLLSLLEASLRSDDSRKYPYLSIKPPLSPVLVAVFPLVKKDGLPDLARSIVNDLRRNGLVVTYDESGSIGRRYARVDEIGCPYAITVDYRAPEEGVVTLRERDSTQQANVSIPELPAILWKLKNGIVEFKSLPQ